MWRPRLIAARAGNRRSDRGISPTLSVHPPASGQEACHVALLQRWLVHRCACGEQPRSSAAIASLQSGRTLACHSSSVRPSCALRLAAISKAVTAIRMCRQPYRGCRIGSSARTLVQCRDRSRRLLRAQSACRFRHECGAGRCLDAENPPADQPRVCRRAMPESW